METSQNNISNELLNLIDESEEFLKSQQIIYGEDIFLDFDAALLSLPPQERKRKVLADLFYRVSKCQNCALAAKRKHMVFGSGNAETEIMVIGEAPGFYEDQKGLPFVGEAGKLLDKILAAIDLSRDNLFITNVLKCRPPENRDPDINEKSACFPILVEQIKIIKPRFILILGRIAAHSLLNMDGSLTALRNKVYDIYDAKALVTYHPAALLRDASKKRETWQDVQLFQKLIKEA